MNCTLLFYTAKKTSLCEKAFTSSSAKMKLDITNTFFATTPAQLGETLIKAFAETDLVFTIGGINDYTDTAINIIMENAFSNNPPDQSYKIKISDTDNEGYLIKKDNQVLVILPDNPEDIKNAISPDLKDFITKYCDI